MPNHTTGTSNRRGRPLLLRRFGAPQLWRPPTTVAAYRMPPITDPSSRPAAPASSLVLDPTTEMGFDVTHAEEADNGQRDRSCRREKGAVRMRGCRHGRSVGSVRWVVLVLVVAVLPSCSVHLGGPRSGHAFAQVYGTLYGVYGAVGIPPGSRVGWLGLFLKNVSDAPLFIERVEPNGRGIGTVIRTVEMQASPNLGYGPSSVHAIWGGIFTSDPPVAYIGGICHSPNLLPLQGFRLSPGQEMRVWMVLEAVGPGRYRVPSHTVTYRQEGATYQQVVPVGYEGKVEPGAEPPHPDPSERPCLDQTTVLG